MVKRKTVKSKIPIRTFHPVPKPEPSRKRSTIQDAKQRVLSALVNYLKVERADYACEICGGRQHLTGAHIIKRAQGRRDHIDNIIIACGLCHDHTQYGNGLPIDTEVAQKLVKERNYDIGLEQISITETACILSRNGIKFNVMEVDEYE
jgi:predicted restriction endonuclease